MEAKVETQVNTSVQPDVQQEQLVAWVARDYDYVRPQRREIREATVLAVQEDRLLVDLGAKRDGRVPGADLERLADEVRDRLQVGAQVPVYVLDAADDRDEIIVSVHKGLAQQDWLRAQELIESDERCECKVKARNRGGVVVTFGRLRGFVPNSHLTSVSRGVHGERLRQAKSELVGKALTLAVIEADPRSQKLVLSERKARRAQRRQFLDELTEGDVRTGTVCNLVNFGAFVDLGGVDGLIHISELAWKHVHHPREVLSVGEQVEVYVLRVDRERERIGLSRKRLLPDPWSTVTDSLNRGDVVEGKVTNVVDFGAFVELGDGVEGLVHISEMPQGAQTAADLSPGCSVQVRVLRIDPQRHRIALSLRGLIESQGWPFEQPSW
jgi:small subunit ribosomal protein S1